MNPIGKTLRKFVICTMVTQTLLLSTSPRTQANPAIAAIEGAAAVSATLATLETLTIAIEASVVAGLISQEVGRHYSGEIESIRWRLLHATAETLEASTHLAEEAYQRITAVIGSTAVQTRNETRTQPEGRERERCGPVSPASLIVPVACQETMRALPRSFSFLPLTRHAEDRMDDRNITIRDLAQCRNNIVGIIAEFENGQLRCVVQCCTAQGETMNVVLPADGRALTIITLFLR